MPSMEISQERLLLNMRWLLVGLSLIAIGFGGGLGDTITLVTVVVTLAYLLALEVMIREQGAGLLLSLISCGGDLFLITWAVHSVDHCFAMLYYIVIIINATRHKKREALLIAVAASLLGGIAIWDTSQGMSEAVFRSFLQGIVFCAVAYLVGRLAESRESERWKLIRLREEEKGDLGFCPLFPMSYILH